MGNQGVLLKVVTPGGEAANLCCDSVQLYLQEDQQGKNGGWIGIRRGHADALVALAPGAVRAKKDDTVIREIPISGGLAFVQDSTVTVLADGAK